MSPTSVECRCSSSSHWAPYIRTKIFFDAIVVSIIILLHRMRWTSGSHVTLHRRSNHWHVHLLQTKSKCERFLFVLFEALKDTTINSCKILKSNNKETWTKNMFQSPDKTMDAEKRWTNMIEINQRLDSQCANFLRLRSSFIDVLRYETPFIELQGRIL